MTSHDFLEMMLLNCCFVLELLHILASDDTTDERDPVFARPWIIPILIRDLLMLENQVLFSILDELCRKSGMTAMLGDSLCLLALRLLDLAYPRSPAVKANFIAFPHHLLHLFYSTLVLTNPYECDDPQKYQPSDQFVPCVTQLRPSGIKFKSSKTENLLDISFRKRVLELLPSITIDDFMTTVLINCVALEQFQENSSKYITDFVSFIYCHINQPKDVSLLCSDGIITRYFHDDQYVVNLFNKLGKSIVFNVQHCHLSRQFEALESYYNSNWAYIRRTYFSSPWSVTAVFSAFLGMALTIRQTVYAVLGHHSR